MPPTVSIISVYYNTPDDLLNLYNSIRRFLPRDLYELIIADNHSDRDLSGEFDAKYIRLSDNLGFAKANNIATRDAKGEFLFFVNPDCVFIEDCITPLLSTIQNAGIAAPKILNSDGTIQYSFGPTLSLFGEASQRRRVRNEKTPEIQRMLQEKTATSFSPDFVGGAALMIRAELFRQLDGFDEAFFLYEEDVDLCERARKLGHKIVYAPSARILHRRGSSAAINSNRVNIEYRKSQIHFYKKHRGVLQTFVLRLYLTLKFLFQPAMLKCIWR